MTQDLDVAIAASRENMQRLAAALVDVDGRILGPDGQRAKSVPSASLLASGDQWHLITAHGPLDAVSQHGPRACRSCAFAWSARA
jgi:hypothetical protein